MRTIKTEILVRLTVLDKQRQPLGGRVDVALKRHGARRGLNRRNADASQDIEIKLAHPGLYHLSVTPAGAAHPVSRLVNICRPGETPVVVVIDKRPASTTAEAQYRVYGAVRDAGQRPLGGVTVSAFDKDIRGDQPLGQPAVTDAQGAFDIAYAQPDFTATDLAAADVFLRVLDQNGKMLRETDVHYNAPAALRLDVDLSDAPYTGPSEFEQTQTALAPFTGALAFADLTEDAKTQDISFLTAKTGLARGVVEAFAFAFRFEKSTGLQAAVFYGLLRTGASATTLEQPAQSATGDFDAKAKSAFAALLRQNLDALMARLAGAIARNIVPYALNGELDAIRTQLAALQKGNGGAAPAPGTVPASDNLTMKLSIAGLQGDQIASFTDLFTASGGASPDLWKALADNQAFQAQKVSLLQSVFALSQLTGEQMVLTDQLVKSQNIQTGADLSKLAANTAADWQGILARGKIDPPPGTPGADAAGKLGNYAATLERNFTASFPTPAFAARIQADAKSSVPGAAAIGQFLGANPDFDLLTTRVGGYVSKRAAAAKRGDTDVLVSHLKKTQRVFKLAPDYASANLLLGDGIDSAHKIYRMGEQNFTARYGAQIGEEGAKRVYAKATKTHTLALAMTANLKSMSDVSTMNVFPSYTDIFSGTLTTEVPDLDTLFGHHDFCECEECRSVYGAAAYLAELLNFLDHRASSIACAANHNASLTEVMLRRRPDLADLDLNCDNTNTTFPYIDIANEIMEDFITPPVVTVAIGLLPPDVGAAIAPAFRQAISDAFVAANQQNVATLLTDQAMVSDKYSQEVLRDDDTCVTQDHWIIRDQFVVLKVTNLTANLEVRLLHQTLLSSDEINASPEYVNIPVYIDTLKNDTLPFTLPFDLFDTEGGVFLGALGTSKADLIAAFHPAHQAPVNLPSPATQADYDLAYVYLGVSEKERTLIFTADPLNQNLYWGPLAAGNTVELDLFMNATGLDYDDVLTLLTLTSINPARDSVIVSDDLSCNTTTKHVNALNGAKFDMIHRFLRLWRKTTFTLQEMDAVVQAPALGAGAITPDLAWKLRAFLVQQKLWSYSVFQYLAFFGNLDTNGDDSLYASLFQNRAITNPLNPDFAVAAVTTGPIQPISAAHQAQIGGALGLAPADLGTLVAASDGNLSLANISQFYRVAQLMQTLSLSLADLLVFLDIINVSPFTDPLTTAAFYDRWRTVVSSQFDAGAFDYVLRHNGSNVPSDDTVAAALADLQGKLLQVQTATAVVPDPAGQLLRKWLTDPVFAWNPTLVSKLFDILGTQDDGEFQQKIDDNNTFLLNLRVQYHDTLLTAPLSVLPALVIPDPDPYAAQISYDAANRNLQLTGYITSGDRDTLKLRSGDAAYKSAVDQLFTAAQQTSSAAANVFFANVAALNASLRALVPGTPANVAARYQLFLTAIAPVYRDLQQQGTVQNELCGWFKINKDMATAIEASKPGIYADLTAAAFVTKQQALTPANYPSQFSWYQKIAKICFLASALKLTTDDLTWFMANAAAIGSLDPWGLPIAPVAGPVATFGGFSVLIQVLKFEQAFPAITQVTSAATTTISIYTVLDAAIAGAATATLEADLCALTSWDSVQLDALANAPNYLNLALPADFKDISILSRLGSCFSLMASIGAPAAACVSWIVPSLGYDESTAIKQTLKARYSDDDWVGIAQPLQAKLRQAKRDALVAHLLANPAPGQSWKSSDDLYGYFLIDVEFTACQPTSRIVQATNSVQQFVQRCFLNLEPDIVIDLDVDPDWSQWPWMKYFRLWQANREVFLYPENWIEPELLPAEIKSPFFDELESDLLQNDVTQDNAETAFLSYLSKLEGVSRLEVKSMWYQDSKQTLHVVARTYGGDPKTYYYRQFVENRRWTPWVKIDQDIASDHIVLTVFNQRIYLFWAVFSEKSQDVTSATMPPLPGSSKSTVTLDNPPKYWQIQMAFSEYKDGKWTPKKVSSADMTGALTVWQYWDDSVQDPVSGGYGAYTPLKSDFVFTPLDLPDVSAIEALFTDLRDTKVGKPGSFLSDLLNDIEQALDSNGDLKINCYRRLDSDSYEYEGTFDLDPCKGYPVVIYDYANVVIPLFDRSQLSSMLDTEDGDTTNDFLSTKGLPYLLATPGTFANLVSLQMGFLDRLIHLILEVIIFLETKGGNFYASREGIDIPISTGTFMPFFYQDASRTYFVQPEISDGTTFEFAYQDLENLILAVLRRDSKTVSDIMGSFPKNKFLFLFMHFRNFYHPLVCSFIRILYDQGLDAMMSRTTQLKGDFVFDPSPGKFDFGKTYLPFLVFAGSPATYNGPSGTVIDPAPAYPKADVDFDPADGYGLYNWELFFHAPLMIAERLSQNLQFEDADHWFKYIFNPTDGSAYPSPDKFWNTKPFFENVNDKYVQQDINTIMNGINAKDSALIQDVTDWRNNPFQPHYIAQYRTVAYQKTVVMKYLDHLIAWGDSLYLQHTMETVMEAEQLYILASQILGTKPLVIPTSYVTPVDNYAQLEQRTLDAFSNTLVDIENLLPLQEVTGFVANSGQDLPSLETLYFCVPPNDKLLGYYDLVAQRLYNIRHCLTLDGQYAPLALFAPKIDPGLLVRAAAAGLDIGSILSDMNSPLPNYRFSVMVQKTLDLCGEVKALGGALLGAMEKQDAEDMALLRSKNGIAVLNAVMAVKKQQVDEATHNLEALQQQQALAQTKADYYQGLITAGLNSGELQAQSLNQTAISGDSSAVQIEYLGNILGLIPDFDIGAEGFGGSPAATVKFGGTQLGGATRAIAAAIRGTAGVAHSQAAVASTQAGYVRRAAEWQFQLNLANAELQQIAKQILAATVRQAVANQEVTNQQLQIDNAQAEDDFMHSKFTNRDLYNYMIGQLSTTYFQSYQLAYALAKQAEQTFRYEIGVADSSYINFGYWNSLRKGLLAGEQLALDVRTMDKAYHDQNAREYELTKHISLSQLDASALELLKTTSECWINLPEELFDMDYPGHYMRRIKSVSLTIPCVAGPYTTVGCTLTMTRNSVRTSNIAGAAYPRKTTNGIAADDPRFRDSVAAIQSIATSSAQNDGGLFELNFRDERYLPFEGAGAISQWHLQLPQNIAAFDYDTIADVIVHVKYTARDGGEDLRGPAGDNLKSNINKMLVALKDTGLRRMFSARHEFPAAWYAFLNPATGADQVLMLDLTLDRFPYFAAMAPTLKIAKIEFVFDTAKAVQGLAVAPATPAALPPPDHTYGTTTSRVLADYTAAMKGAGTWTITIPKAHPLAAADLADLIAIVQYQLTF